MRSGLALSTRVRPLELRLSAAPFLGAIAAALILVVTSRYGIGLDTDSMQYLYAGNSFAHGHGLRYIDGGTWVWWPPLYPVLLGIGSLPFGHIEQVGRVLSAVSFGALVCLCGLWLERQCRSRLVALIGTLGVLFLVPQWIVMANVFSEAPFIVFTMGSLFAVGGACARPSLRLVMLGGLLAAAAWLTRYVGLSVAFTGFLALLVWPSAPLPQRARMALLFGAIAGIPFALWAIHYHQVTHYFPGFGYVPHLISGGQALSMIPGVVASWIVPPSLPQSSLLGWVILTVAVSAGAAMVAGHAREPVIRDVAPYAFPVCLYVPTFLFWFLNSYSHYLVGAPDDRLLYPVAVPALLVAVLTLDRLYAIYHRRALPVVVLAAVWLLYPASNMRRLSDQYLSTGVPGYSAAPVIKSQILTHARALPRRGTLFASDPYALYAVTGRWSDPSPTHVPMEWPSDWGSVEFLRRAAVKRLPVTLVWSDCCPSNSLPLPVLQRWVRLTVRSRRSDGAIYTVTVRKEVHRS